jgi:hypothetical protein
MDRLPIKIELDLKRHCIETDIRKQYNRYLSRYFQSSEDRDNIEQKISLLKHALETLDFGQLRVKHPDLSGHTQKQVVLSWNGMSMLSIRIGTKQVNP